MAEKESGASSSHVARADEPALDNAEQQSETPEDELSAEEDSAQAMDAEVSHGEDESETTEGQPS